MAVLKTAKFCHHEIKAVYSTYKQWFVLVIHLIKFITEDKYKLSLIILFMTSYLIDSSTITPFLTDISVQPTKSCSLHTSSISDCSTSRWSKSHCNVLTSQDNAKAYYKIRKRFSQFHSSLANIYASEYKLVQHLKHYSI